MTPRERVLAALPQGIDAVVLETPGAVAWYLGGARVSVALGGPAIVVVLVARDGDHVRSHVMEAGRLRDEEGVNSAVIARVPWPEPLIPADWREDPRILREHELDEPLRAARAALTRTEARRYRELGSEVARAVTAAALDSRSGDLERTVAGDLAARLYGLGAEPVVVLVAGASRLGYRHPLPTAAPLGDRAMLVVGARRHGLIVNLTRWVTFGSGRDASAIDAAEHSLRRVEAAVLDATVPGRALADVFADLRAAYEAEGFGADEWRLHHQGGPTGYIGRDPKVAPGTSGVVADPQAFAWNPSASGVKVEDTVLASASGIELLTHDPDWPTTEVSGRSRPLTLHR